jgi:hypothetical protein
VSTGIFSGLASPDPLDDAVYHYPPAPDRAVLENLLHGRMPYNPFVPGRAGSRPANATRRVVVLSLLDAWAFVWSLAHGAAWLVPIACAGLVATAWHLRLLTQRLRAARRPRRLGRYVPCAALSGSAAGTPGGPRRRVAHHQRFTPPSSLSTRTGRRSRWPAWGVPFPAAAVVVAVSGAAALVVHLTVLHG